MVCVRPRQVRYSTTFPLNENPLSERGVWTPGTANAGRTNVQTSGGVAYGTMSSFDGVNYTDSISCLSGFGGNHSVQATLVNNGAVSGLETELALRVTNDGSVNTGYEVDLVYSSSSVYLVRWNGPVNDFTILLSAITANVSLANGAIWYAEILGNIITVKCNGATVLTHDISGDTGLQIMNGNPGMGFWNETGSSANSPNFGWDDFVANQL